MIITSIDTIATIRADDDDSGCSNSSHSGDSLIISAVFDVDGGGKPSSDFNWSMVCEGS